MDHAAEAERLLAALANDHHNDAAFQQVVATRALAHATLAGLPVTPSVWPAPNTLQQWPGSWETITCVPTTGNHDDPKIVYQGKDVRRPTTANDLEF